MKKRQWKRKQNGAVEIIILAGIVLFSIVTAGLFFNQSNPSNPFSSTTITIAPGSCCDTPDCSLITDPSHTFTFNGSPYGLLKSNVTLREGGDHLKDSGQKFNGNPIILNITDGLVLPNGKHECGQGKMDQIWNINGTPKCWPIPNDEIVYVCRSNCVPGNCKNLNKSDSCYGDKTTVYDIYFRTTDIPSPGIPQPIKDCTGNGSGTGSYVDNVNPTIVMSPYTSHSSEQLHTFEFITPTPYNLEGVPWISPYCKPALYFYPPSDEAISVKIAPKGVLNYTNPPYPSGGWDIMAHPNGAIDYRGKTYPYLYYEAGIPDALITVDTNEGYVSSYDNLSKTFAAILPGLGLNSQETSDFMSYWLKALPKASYYAMYPVSQETLETISPLTIEPKPDTTLRMTLYFQPLDTPVILHKPNITPAIRGKFHVTEWGGAYKKDKNHQFTCLQ